MPAPFDQRRQGREAGRFAVAKDEPTADVTRRAACAKIGR